MPNKQKVVVYVVEHGRLLVFRHVDLTCDVEGIQVPAGQIKEGEEPEAAALRQLHEETGYTGFKIVSFLGTAIYKGTLENAVPQERHFFLAEPTERLPERWEAQEGPDGEMPNAIFECFWLPLNEADVLQAGHGALLEKI